MLGIQGPFGVEKGDAGSAQIAFLAAVLVVGVHYDGDDLAAGVGVLGKFVCSCGAFAVTTVTGLPIISCQSLLPPLAARNCDLWPLIGR